MRRLTCIGLLGIVLAGTAAMFGAAHADAQTVDINGRYQVTETDESAGNGTVFSPCVTPWSVNPTGEHERDDGIVKVTTAGDTVIFARDDNTVLLSATLSAQDDSFTGESSSRGQPGDMYVANGFSQEAKFVNNGFTITEPHVNYGGANECWQVDIRGTRISGGDAGPQAAAPPVAAPQVPTPARKRGGSNTGVVIGGAALLGAGGIAVARRRRRKGPTDCVNLRAQYDQLLSSYQTNEARLRNALENLTAQQGNLAESFKTARALEEQRDEALAYLAAAAIVATVAAGAEAAATLAARAAAAEALESVAACSSEQFETMWRLWRSYEQATQAAAL